jgi:hypothetical protein
VASARISPGDGPNWPVENGEVGKITVDMVNHQRQSHGCVRDENCQTRGMPNNGPCVFRGVEKKGNCRSVSSTASLLPMFSGLQRATAPLRWGSHEQNRAIDVPDKRQAPRPSNEICETKFCRSINAIL